jgi:hypothetical protein
VENDIAAGCLERQQPGLELGLDLVAELLREWHRLISRST